jgi:UDPglucose--hexose-1-phosphate uridylyltransferase
LPRGLFFPAHDLTLARMSQEEILPVVNIWTEEMSSMEAFPWVRYVQIFENRGALMGASNPHPHCQIWASGSIPNVPQRELHSFEGHRKKNARCLLCDYLHTELIQKERIVCENEHFLALVPFWAVWPFESMILSKRHLNSLVEFRSEEKESFAEILRRVTIRYDNLFETSFPYSMGLHQSPSNTAELVDWHFHAHFVPPLLRSAMIQKFMVGYELLASPQSDMTAEDAASRLAALSEIHYLDRDYAIAISKRTDSCSLSLALSFEWSEPARHAGLFLILAVSPIHRMCSPFRQALSKGCAGTEIELTDALPARMPSADILNKVRDGCAS